LLSPGKHRAIRQIQRCGLRYLACCVLREAERCRWCKARTIQAANGRGFWKVNHGGNQWDILGYIGDMGIFIEDMLFDGDANLLMLFWIIVINTGILLLFMGLFWYHTLSPGLVLSMGSKK
jgi:hypothetical protein